MKPNKDKDIVVLEKASGPMGRKDILLQSELDQLIAAIISDKALAQKIDQHVKHVYGLLQRSSNGNPPKNFGLPVFPYFADLHEILRATGYSDEDVTRIASMSIRFVYSEFRKRDVQT